MWNVMDIWIILENNNFFLLLPNRMPLFHFLQRNHCDTKTVTIDELSNIDGLVK